MPNAFTYGHTRPFIVLTSGLVDMLDDEERFFVVAHELGHIKAGHVLYTVLARNIAAIVSSSARPRSASARCSGQGLVLALHDWFRKAELTADRAGPAVRAGSRPLHPRVHEAGRRRGRLYAEMDQNEFMRQIRAYEDADARR